MAAAFHHGVRTLMDGTLAQVLGARIPVVALAVVHAARGDWTVETEVGVQVAGIGGTGVVVIAIGRGGAGTEFGVGQVLAFVVHTTVQGVVGAIGTFQVNHAALGSPRAGMVAGLVAVAGFLGAVVNGAGVGILAVRVHNAAVGIARLDVIAAVMVVALRIGA